MTRIDIGDCGVASYEQTTWMAWYPISDPTQHRNLRLGDEISGALAFCNAGSGLKDNLRKVGTFRKEGEKRC